MTEPLFTLNIAAKLPEFSLSALLTEAFNDYVAGPMHLNAVQAERFLQAGGVELESSLVASSEDFKVGFTLVGRAFGHSRIASMGTIPGWRCRGIGKAMLTRCIDDAKARGDKSICLEVFERNLPAVALYEHAGFLNRGRLRGWKLGSSAAAIASESNPPNELLAGEFLSLAKVSDFPQLPWQLSSHGASLVQDRLRFFRKGRTALALKGLASEQVQIRSLAQEPNASDEELTALLYNLLRAFPGTEWTAPTFWPEQFAPSFEANGFTANPLTQLLMQLDL
jgi:ribosomal protein S18 acetylase RimI-like enzyme